MAPKCMCLKCSQPVNIPVFLFLLCESINFQIIIPSQCEKENISRSVSVVHLDVSTQYFVLFHKSIDLS
jgi:hypothetical protein